MAWIILLIAGLLEVVWAVGLKFTNGWTRLWPSLITVAAMSLSVYLLSIAARSLPIGTAYAVWTGIGAAGAVLIGMFFLNEPRDPARFLCLFLIVAGIIGLRLLSGGE
ncbi:MAG: quaternary ammonium compound efflux SMR transporter SugE [Chloroflexota bacterium]